MVSLFNCVVFLIISTLLVDGKGGSDDCTKEHNAYNECLLNIHYDRKASGESNREKIDSDGRTCFKKHNCNEPTDDDIENTKKGQGKGKAKEAGAKKGGYKGPTGETRRNCYDKINDNFRDSVEKCIRQKMPSFKFPLRKKSTASEGKKQQGHNFGAFHELAEDACSDEKSKLAMKKCLNDTFHKHIDNKEERRAKAQSRYASTCDAREACFQKISPACRDGLNDTKNAMCECAKKEYAANRVQYEAEYHTCAGSTPPPKTAGGVPHKTAQYHGSGVESFVHRMCSQQQDPCSDRKKHREL